MSALALGTFLLAAFLAASLAADRLAPRARALPLLGLGLLLGAGAMECARFDHGLGDALFAIGMVAAPVLFIFAASAAGARRWYGWPDLGAVPGRLALVSGLLLLGVLVGTRVKDSDVVATMARGDELAGALRAWRAAHEGAWPARLEDARPDPPRTRMGALAPPAFAWDATTGVLSFPLDARRRLEREAAPPEAPWKRP